jgi:hypothetical protein
MILHAALELLCHASSRSDLASFLESASLATVDKDGEILPAEGVQLHPFRVTEELVVERDGGKVQGWHCNLRFYGPLADELSGGGLAKIAGLMAERIKGSCTYTSKEGYIPEGYKTDSGVTLYLADAVTWRRNVWA